MIILASVIPERGTVPPAPLRQPRPPVTPVGVALFNSKHRFSMIGPTMKCINCFETAPRLRSHLLDWLKSDCRTDRSLVYAYFTGIRKPAALPRHRPVSVGRRVAHDSAMCFSAIRALSFVETVATMLIRGFSGSQKNAMEHP